MNIIENKTNNELYESLLAEVAKAKHEINCARGDIEKANNRLSFTIMLINKLVERSTD